MLRWMFLVAALVMAGSAGSVKADLLNAVNRGWYESDGTTETGFLLSGIPNNSYIAGRACHFDDVSGALLGHFEFNNFFVFDLTGRTTPVTAASLKLYIPLDALSGPGAIGYQSPFPSDVYALFDVSTPLSTLQGSVNSTSAFADLGSGISYGSRTVTGPDIATQITIDLNAAGLAAVNANLGGFFVVGGAVTSLDRTQSMDQIVFAFSHNYTGTGLNDGNTQLQLSPDGPVIPAPPAVFLIAAALPVLGVLRLRRKVG